MFYTKEFERIIKLLPKKIKDNKRFEKECRSSQPERMNRNRRFKEVMEGLESEFHYNSDNVKKCIGEDAYEEMLRWHQRNLQLESELQDGYVCDFDESTRTLYLSKRKADENLGKKDERLKNYLGVSIKEMDIAKRECDIFEYNYNKVAFWRCIERILTTYPIDDTDMLESAIKALSTNALSSHDSIFDLKGQLSNIVIWNCNISRCILNELRWLLEKNVSLDNEDNIRYIEIYDKDLKMDNESFMVEINNNSCVDSKTHAILKKNTAQNKEQDFQKKIEELIDRENAVVSKYLDSVYQARIIMNEKMKKILKGGGNVTTFKARLKNLGFLRENLTEYEAFIIEKQSRFYLTYIMQLGIIKSQLLDQTDLSQLSKYNKERLNIFKNDENGRDIDLKSLLINIKKGTKDKLPCKIQLILILVRVISSIHSCEISLDIAMCIMSKLENIREFSDAKIKDLLVRIDEDLIEWVEEFNNYFDFVMMIMVYMCANRGTKEKLEWLRKYVSNDFTAFFKYIDDEVMNIHKGTMKTLENRGMGDRQIIGRIIETDGDCMEQKILREINKAIIHECYPAVFEI